MNCSVAFVTDLGVFERDAFLAMDAFNLGFLRCWLEANGEIEGKYAFVAMVVWRAVCRGSGKRLLEVAIYCTV